MALLRGVATTIMEYNSRDKWERKGTAFPYLPRVPERKGTLLKLRVQVLVKKIVGRINIMLCFVCDCELCCDESCTEYELLPCVFNGAIMPGGEKDWGWRGPSCQLEIARVLE
ncbi:hypothetical protein J6590_007190 [Homalodisca vitripennis]|nr:hypothetical protein J6590_007190 [Homalodisca vitripennis]